MDIHKKILLVDDDTDDQLFFVDAIKELEPTLECNVANSLPNHFVAPRSVFERGVFLNLTSPKDVLPVAL